MKYDTFTLVESGDNPLIRITFEYENMWGQKKRVVRDVIKHKEIEGYWVFCDNAELTQKYETIQWFYESKQTVYFVNGTQ